jgi:hypothetical protein
MTKIVKKTRRKNAKRHKKLNQMWVAEDRDKLHTWFQVQIQMTQIELIWINF